MGDNTCYIERSEVRQILLRYGIESAMLAEIDALTIFNADDFRDAAQPVADSSGPNPGAIGASKEAAGLAGFATVAAASTQFGNPIAWLWRTLPEFSEDADDREWSLTSTAPDFINPHHHEVQPLYASPPSPVAGEAVDKARAWDAVIAAREDERRECAGIAEKYDDCGGQFIAQRIRDRCSMPSTNHLPRAGATPAQQSTATEPNHIGATPAARDAGSGPNSGFDSRDGGQPISPADRGGAAE